MVKFLSTRATSAKIEEIISGAKRHIVLVSPFIRLSPSIIQLINEAVERKIETVIIYGKSESQPNIDDQVKKISGVEVYFVKNLHAKCYFNEELMLLSSMNLHEFSEINNWEMSVLIDKNQDAEIYSGIVSELKRILKSIQKELRFDLDVKSPSNLVSPERAVSIPVYMQDLRKKLKQVLKSIAPGGGFCIRCGERVPADHDKPYCKTCYLSWLRYENYDYVEKRCHLCGKAAETTIEYPLCLQCINNIASKFDKEKYVQR